MNPMEKIFTVLEAVISHQENGLTFANTVASTALPKASVHRILKGMTELGYLNFNSETKRYRGALKLAALGAEVTSNFDLRNLVHPQLIRLQKETSHTSNMAIKNGAAGIYVDKIESQDYGIKLISGIGKSFPLYCTGLGKVLLAYSPPSEANRILSKKLKSYTENTITDPQELKKELRQIKKQGYALDRQEVTRGIMCVAAPVFGIGAEIVCAISVAFPSYVNSDRGIDLEIEAVKRHAAAISGSFSQR
ncbi:MAG: IclR family transcriptional regulator [Desulfobacterales bacterium]|jgi:DNA-binding IclR family transcriptional regulator